MVKFKEVRVLKSGMNTDDAAKIIAPDAYIDALNSNFHNVKAGQDAFVLNKQGNELKTATPPYTGPGTFCQVVGFIKDETNNQGIYFIYSPSGYHQIRCYHAD